MCHSSRGSTSCDTISTLVHVKIRTVSSTGGELPKRKVCRVESVPSVADHTNTDSKFVDVVVGHVHVEGVFMIEHVDVDVFHAQQAPDHLDAVFAAHAGGE